MRRVDGSVLLSLLAGDDSRVFEDHEPGCSLHEPVNWLRAAAMEAEARASFAELDDVTFGIPADVLRNAAPSADERSVAWCTCRRDAEPPSGQGWSRGPAPAPGRAESAAFVLRPGDRDGCCGFVRR